jgi:hypothetical protein
MRQAGYLRFFKLVLVALDGQKRCMHGNQYYRPVLEKPASKLKPIAF